MDIKRLLQDYNINYKTEGNKHCTKGWINVHCPFCPGSRDYHLGIHEEGTGANCWRCGPHHIIKVIAALLGISEREAKTIAGKYGNIIYRKKEEEPRVSIFPLRFPKPNSKLTGPYKKYLERRGFDPEKLERIWGLRQTGPISFLDDINYSHRILIPIYWGGKIVSFQARDITEKSQLKYLACPKRREKIHHKNILYRHKKGRFSKGIIVVEGVPDVWRLGVSSVATFGVEFKMEQVLELAKMHHRFFIIFDEDKNAQKQAKKLAVKLKTLGRNAEVIKIKGDPGDMGQKEANYLIKQLLRRK